MSAPSTVDEFVPDAALATLAHISESLVESYRALALRAERVEHELSRANAALEAKVAELDAVTRHLEAILHALPTGVVVRDAEGLIARANQAALALLGARTEELAGRASLPGLEPAAAGPERGLVRPDGSRRVVATRRSSFAGADGLPAGEVEILDDRTELSRLQERVHRMDKIAALGNVAAGIAHEIRNPMNAIKGFAALLRREQLAGSRAERWSSLIMQGVDEVDQIVTSMLSFARPERLHKERLDARELVEGAVLAAGLAAPWTLAAAASAPDFLGDRIKLRHALRNLISNAAEAQPAGGAIQVALERAGDELVVSVDDAGPGIAPELAARIFDPFFTTRAEGTGLGLSLVTTIAELHGGRVDVAPERSPLGGARVVLRIPFESPSAAPASHLSALPTA